jgi:hemerythrin
MRLHAYAAMESHLEEHERLRATVQQVKQSLGAGNPADTQNLIEALRSWLSVHIQTTDRALANYLSQRVSGPLTEPEK